MYDLFFLTEGVNIVNFRTDLAIESNQHCFDNIEGVYFSSEKMHDMNISRMTVKSEKAANKLRKPKGEYITVEGLPMTDNFRDASVQIKEISKLISPLIPEKGTILVIGIGNTNITPDALGPAAAECVIATRHISKEIAKSSGLDKLRSVAVLSPGVLGQTGIDVSEIILSLTKSLEPSAVIAIDALCCASPSHLGKTIQISSSGIEPGSGIGNKRPSLNKSTIGIPVIGIGMPTVADITPLASKFSETDKTKKSGYSDSLIVTPKEIDLLIARSSRLIGMAVNCAIQKNYSFEVLSMLSS